MFTKCGGSDGEKLAFMHRVPFRASSYRILFGQQAYRIIGMQQEELQRLNDLLVLSRILMAQEGEELAVDSHQFVSSVCWSRKGHTLLAANSQGTLKLLELD